MACFGCRCHFLRSVKPLGHRTQQCLFNLLSTDVSVDSTNAKQNSDKLIKKTKQKLHLRCKPTTKVTHQKLSEKSREMAVPATKISRMVNYGTLMAGLGVGAINESIKKQFGLSTGNSIGGSSLLSEANIERIVSTLCKVRGAALKFGQMMSIQDNSFIPEDMQKVFERVRANADYMPLWQLEKVMIEEFGVDWRNKFKTFDNRPFAAASIGQVHVGVTKDDTHVAVKIQYPGVAESIHNDIDTLLSILIIGKLLPEGLFLEQAADVARKELAWEVDYQREAACSVRFKELLADDEDFFVADFFPKLSSKRVLTTELMNGVPLDAVFSMDQDTRNKVAFCILRLCLKELFEFNFMQTDPNWSNFLYNQDTDQICLLDFGASREYPKTFVDAYIKVIRGAADGDRKEVNNGLTKLGFQTGYESRTFIAANVDAVMILGEPFARNEVFDFSAQDITKKIKDLIPVLLAHRLVPPPEETYSLHRKMSGAFLLCTKLGAKINCYGLFDEIWKSYKQNKYSM